MEKRGINAIAENQLLQRVSRLTRLGAMCITNGAELVMPLCVFSLLLLLLLVLLLLVHRRKRNTSSLDRETQRTVSGPLRRLGLPVCLISSSRKPLSSCGLGA